MLIGYKYNAISIGEKLKDECIKIKATPEKCSWRTLGYINDINALAYSSNVYQYKIAIKVGNGNYQHNKGLKIDESAFDKYRDMYHQFGLGVKTGIDLPVESLGYAGKSKKGLCKYFRKAISCKGFQEAVHAFEVRSKLWNKNYLMYLI